MLLTWNSNLNINTFHVNNTLLEASAATIQVQFHHPNLYDSIIRYSSEITSMLIIQSINDNARCARVAPRSREDGRRLRIGWLLLMPVPHSHMLSAPRQHSAQYTTQHVSRCCQLVLSPCHTLNPLLTIISYSIIITFMHKTLEL